MDNIHDIIAIHRGRNRTTTKLVKSVTSIDYNFDFRGFVNGSKLNPIWLLLKAWINANEIPESKLYLVEGGMLFWVSYFLKKKYKKSKILLIVPEPAFYFDPRKSKLQKLFFNFKVKSIKKTIDLLLPNSMMIYRDATKLTKCKIPYYHLRYPIKNFDRVTYKSDKNILFVCERPHDTGYVKGLDNVLSIFEKVQKKEADSNLYIVGTGTEHLNLPNKNIHCLGRVDMNDVFNRCSVLISPARYDAFLMVVPEAASAGLITIVSNKVGASELIPNNLREDLIIEISKEDLWVDNIIKSFSYSKEIREEFYNHFQEELKLYKEEILLKSLKDICRKELED
ncbi:glycosyltransferase family 4 protein [Bacteriovorax sp. DB6_IX]|uniref:glycosyltransferase family 4 protein n=1 Tax=Bacteriovorax sp. DB6_IX TaxID=1353530 RepID=UPI00038A360C|nr:glycosyltransferase [Bacteriovorax sp. DB6_IX]EQC49624.1 glycosyltransferase, group 1 family protein [Bacteriovorax sp. DB6_IX]